MVPARLIGGPLDGSTVQMPAAFMTLHVPAFADPVGGLEDTVPVGVDTYELFAAAADGALLYSYGRRVTG